MLISVQSDRLQPVKLDWQMQIIIRLRTIILKRYWLVLIDDWINKKNFEQSFFDYAWSSHFVHHNAPGELRQGVNMIRLDLIKASFEATF